MAGKIVALFVEGDTEIEFYKAVVNYVHEKQELLSTVGSSI